MARAPVAPVRNRCAGGVIAASATRPSQLSRSGTVTATHSRRPARRGQLGWEPLRRTYFTMFRRRGSRKNPDNGEDHYLGLED